MAVPAEQLAYLDYPQPGQGDHSQKVPTNEYGIVIPPPIGSCIGDLCRFKQPDEESCESTVHHLHSTLDDYLENGRVAHRFRTLPILTVWLPGCRHQIHHEIHEISVRIPYQDIMSQGIREARRVRKLATIHSNLRTIKRELTGDGLTQKQIYGLQSVEEELYEDREEILPRIMTIEVIPEELVTGALLICAPDLAQRRLLAGTGYVLTGTLNRNEIPEAIDIANEILELAA